MIEIVAFLTVVVALGALFYFTRDTKTQRALEKHVEATESIVSAELKEDAKKIEEVIDDLKSDVKAVAQEIEETAKAVEKKVKKVTKTATKPAVKKTKTAKPKSTTKTKKV